MHLTCLCYFNHDLIQCLAQQFSLCCYIKCKQMLNVKEAVSVKSGIRLFTHRILIVKVYLSS